MFTLEMLNNNVCTSDQYWSQFIEPRNLEDVVRVTGGLDNLKQKGVDGFGLNTWYFLAIYPNSMKKLHDVGDRFSVNAIVNINKLAARQLIETSITKVVDSDSDSE